MYIPLDLKWDLWHSLPLYREWGEIWGIFSQSLSLHHFEIINHSLLLQSNFIDRFKEHWGFVYCICNFYTQPEKDSLKNVFCSFLFVLKYSQWTMTSIFWCSSTCVLCFTLNGIVHGTVGYSRQKMFSHSSSLLCKQDHVTTDIQPPISVSHYQLRRQLAEGA